MTVVSKSASPTRAASQRASSGLRSVAPLMAAVFLAFGALNVAPASAASGTTAATSPAAGTTATPSNSYEPEVGQAGKDVIWVPTPQALVDKMLDIAEVTPADYLIDLGAGDGRTVITAAKRGLKAHGIEYNADMVALAKQRAEKEGVSDRATFTAADLFESDLTQAQVITMFLLPSINEKLRPTILDLKPGTRIVSNSFRMGEWQPDGTTAVEGSCQSWCTAYLWIVPAKVDGTWQLNGQPLALKQTFQQVNGTLGSDPISEASLKGDTISFKAGGTQYTGRVDGKKMAGETTGDRSGTWTATLN